MISSTSSLGPLNLNAGTSSAVNIDSFAQGSPNFERKGSSWSGYWWDFKPSAYEEELIITACKVTKATFNPDAGIPLTSATRFFVNDGSFGFTGIYETSQKKKLAFVAFRGSYTKEDWKDNADFRRQDDTYSGFYLRIKDSFSTWRDQIVTLKRSNPDLNDVMFTGISLGAAESHVGALMLAENRPAELRNMKVHVINFGSPRPGGKDFQSRFKDNVVLYRRIVNAGDSITNLPPYAMDYTHVDIGLMFWASSNGVKDPPFF